MEPLGLHEETHSSEQWLLDTFEQAAVGIAQISPEGKWLRLNRKYCEILGYSQDELMNKTFQEITHPDDLELSMRIHQKLFKGEIDNFTWEKRYIRKDGSLIWARILASLVRDTNGTSLYSIAVVEDISERKKAEEELKRSEEREHLASEIIDNIRSEIDLDIILWHTVEGIGQFTQADRCLIWLYDSKTQCLQIPNADREYCRSPEITTLTSIINDFPGMEKTIISDNLVFPYALGYTKVANISNISTVPGLTAEDWRGIEARDIKSFLHVPILYKDQYLGCIRVHSTVQYRQWDEETVSLVQHMAAKVAVAIHHAKTVRELKSSEEALKSYANKLQESNKNLEYFATIASHDLQAPLRKVQLFSTHLHQSAMERLTEEEKDDIVRMQKAIAKMQALINDLLDLSRVSRKGKPFQKADLSTIIKEALNDLQPLITKTDGRVDIGETLTVEVDQTQIQSLIFNLISNGLKFHRQNAPPIVKISVVPVDEQYYDLMVSDNGIGIEEEHLNDIFEIFRCLNGESYPGTGVGLTLCKKIVERHGGSISATSNYGQGSTFKARLPFTPARMPEPQNDL